MNNRPHSQGCDVTLRRTGDFEMSSGSSNVLSIMTNELIDILLKHTQKLSIQGFGHDGMRTMLILQHKKPSKFMTCTIT